MIPQTGIISWCISDPIEDVIPTSKRGWWDSAELSKHVPIIGGHKNVTMGAERGKIRVGESIYRHMWRLNNTNNWCGKCTRHPQRNPQNRKRITGIGGEILNERPQVTKWQTATQSTTAHKQKRWRYHDKWAIRGKGYTKVHYKTGARN